MLYNMKDIELINVYSYVCWICFCYLVCMVNIYKCNWFKFKVIQFIKMILYNKM